MTNSELNYQITTLKDDRLDWTGDEEANAKLRDELLASGCGLDYRGSNRHYLRDASGSWHHFHNVSHMEFVALAWLKWKEITVSE